MREIRSRPARGAWIEIAWAGTPWITTGSRPARGAWIEMARTAPSALRCPVAPRKGRVD